MGIFSRLLANPPALPVSQSLDEVRAALPVCVIQAPPGSGKTTLIPPLVADGVTGKVVVTQPRRVAVRAAARRLAQLIGQPVGEAVGYSVRGESKVSPQTRVEFVTPGVLLRRMHRDNELSDVSALIFDEVHERGWESDLALAFGLEIAGLREDLHMVIMSATVDTANTAQLVQHSLGDMRGIDVPVVDIPASLHPLNISYIPPARDSQALGVISGAGHTGVRREFLDFTASTVADIFLTQQRRGENGSILVFLPGVREISWVTGELDTLLKDSKVEIAQLHGQLSPSQQDAALAPPGAGSKIIVSTAVAESSLTVPGVRTVVDAGLERRPYTDIKRGISGLHTVSESRAAGIQRAGRAAREAPGTAYRLMAEESWGRLEEFSPPEVATAELTDFMMHAVAWAGSIDAALALPLLTPPPQNAIRAATQTLQNIGIINNDGALVSNAERYAQFPADVRIVHAMGKAAVPASLAARIGAILSDIPRLSGADLENAERAGNAAWKQQAKQQGRRLEKNLLTLFPDLDTAEATASTADFHEALGFIAASAYPEHIARLRQTQDARRYIMANGAGATLPERSPLEGSPWIAIADISAIPGSSDSLIRAAVEITENIALAAGSHMLRAENELFLSAGRVKSRRTQLLGAIELSVQDNQPAGVEDVRKWVPDALQNGELELTFAKDAQNLRERIQFLHANLGDAKPKNTEEPGWPSLDDDSLPAILDIIAGPEIEDFARGAAWPRITKEMLMRALPWPLSQQVDEFAPERITIPTGSTRAIDYSKANPTLSLRVQEAFGWKDAPRLANGKVSLTIELLSPAQRPVAITADLRGFWEGSYAQVRSEMRGRYPRHHWPEDALNAQPTSRAKSSRR